MGIGNSSSIWFRCFFGCHISPACCHPRRKLERRCTSERCFADLDLPEINFKKDWLVSLQIQKMSHQFRTKTSVKKNCLQRTCPPTSAWTGGWLSARLPSRCPAGQCRHALEVRLLVLCPDVFLSHSGGGFFWFGSYYVPQQTTANYVKIFWCFGKLLSEPQVKADLGIPTSLETWPAPSWLKPCFPTSRTAVNTNAVGYQIDCRGNPIHCWILSLRMAFKRFMSGVSKIKQTSG